MSLTRSPIYQTFARSSRYLLDLAKRDATSAYSLRQVSKINHPLIRVRRSSDSAEMDFYPSRSKSISIAGLEAFVQSGDGYISVWYDALGNNHLTQTNVSQQPKIAENGRVLKNARGNPIVRFSGANQTSLVSSSYVGINYPIAHVVAVDVPSVASRGAIIKIGINNGIGLGFGSGTFDADGSSIIGLKEVVAWCPTSGTFSANTPMVLSQTESGSLMTIRKNMTPLSVTSSGVNALPYDRICYVGGYSNRFVTANLSELVTFSYINQDLISQIEKQMITQYN